MARDDEGEVLAETENMFVWRSDEAEVGFLYHVEMGGVTLHLLADEWDELVVLVNSASR
jgi:hypothetical protein